MPRRGGRRRAGTRGGGVGDKKKKGATKKKVSSIPPKNNATAATKAKGRQSALKDSIGNAYAGGQEFKAVVLNTLDVVEEGGVVTSDQMLDMVTALGTATPLGMANATGGETNLAPTFAVAKD